MGNEQRQGVPSDPREWRPQVARRARRTTGIRDPILEPFWRGVRVIAHFHAGQGDEGSQLALIDELGEEVSHLAPRAAAELGRAIMALDAVVDGILTTQATADGTGTAIVPTAAHLSVSSMIVPRVPEVTHAPPRGYEPAGGEPAFVALDLLSVDGQRLLDLPLLERKRLLEGLFLQSELVRVSIYTRPPVKQWLSSWKSAGFRGLMMKAANSRYRPGDLTSEWALVERESQG